MSMLPLAPLFELVCQDCTATARGPTSPAQKPNIGPPDCPGNTSALCLISCAAASVPSILNPPCQQGR